MLLCLGSANRDEHVFEDSSRFIPGRKPGNDPEQATGNRSGQRGEMVESKPEPENAGDTYT